MGMRRRLPTSLALVAAMTFLLQPALCDALHALDAQAHAEGPHDYDPDGDHDHVSHPIGEPDSPAQTPELEDVHHCCGGHDRPFVVLTQKATAPDLDLHWLPPG